MGHSGQVYGHHQAGRESGEGHPGRPGKSTSVAGTTCLGPMLRDRGTGQHGMMTARRSGTARRKNGTRKTVDAQPDDLSIKRRLTEFFLRTKQMSDAKAQLNAIRKRAMVSRLPKRSRLGQAHARLDARVRNRQTAELEALSCFEPNDQAAAVARKARALEDPEDLRVLARVLDAQKTACTANGRSRSWSRWLTRTSPTGGSILLAQLYEPAAIGPKPGKSIVS